MGDGDGRWEIERWKMGDREMKDGRLTDGRWEIDRWNLRWKIEGCGSGKTERWKVGN